MMDLEAGAALATWFGIMLDDEYDSVMPDYFPVRGNSQVRADVEREMWIRGNPEYWPSSEWVAELIRSKSLIDPNSRATFGGAIYRFTSRMQGGV